MLFPRLTCVSPYLLLSVCFAVFPGNLAFGQAPNPQETAEATTEAPAAELEVPEFANPDPATELLLREAERSPRALGDALASLARVNKWAEVNQLLIDAGERQLDDEAKATVAGLLGPALIVRIATRSEISDEARQFLDTLNQAAAAQQSDPERLNEAISNIDAESVDERLQALRILLRGGQASIRALVAAVAENPQSPRRDEWLRVLLELGEGGHQALQQLALYGKPEQRAGALSAWARLDREEAVPAMVAALHAGNSASGEREVARDNLARVVKELPDRSSAQRLLEAELARAITRAREAEANRDPMTLWYVDGERTGVQAIQADSLVAAYRGAFDAAAQLLRVGAPSDDSANKALVADLNYRVLVDPEWGTEEQLSTIRQVHRPDAEKISAAIELTLQDRDQPAAVGLLKLIDDRLPQRTLLNSASSDPTPLVRAAYAGQPRIRYEAVAAIARLDPEQSYTGISEVNRTVREMLTLDSLPTAIVVETRPEVIQRLESLLTQLGYRVEVVSTMEALEQAVHEGGDIRFVLAKTYLADFAPIELVDRIRRLPRGRQIPIAFFGESEPVLGAERWPGVTVTMQEPMTAAGMRPMSVAIDDQRRLPELSAAERRIFREVAERFATVQEERARAAAGVSEAANAGE